MEIQKAITLTALAILVLQIEAIPIRNATTLSIQNSTIPTNSFSSDSKLDNLIKSARDGLRYLAQDAKTFQEALVPNHLNKINVNSILLSFSSFNFNPVRCSPYQLIDRAELQEQALRKFADPMNFIFSELSNDQRTQNLAISFNQLRSTFQNVQIAFNKILSTFLVREKSISQTTTQELTRQTVYYLGHVHQSLKLSAQEIQALRDYVFAKDMITVASIIRSELIEQFGIQE